MSIRILHLANIGFLAQEDPNALILALRQVSEGNPDGLVLAGISNEADSGEFKRVLDFIRQLMTELKLSPEQILIAPGPKDLGYGYGHFSDSFYQPLKGTAFNHRQPQFLTFGSDFQIFMVHTVPTLEIFGCCEEDFRDRLQEARDRVPNPNPGFCRTLFCYHPVADWSFPPMEAINQTWANGESHFIFSGFPGNDTRVPHLLTFGVDPQDFQFYQFNPTRKALTSFQFRYVEGSWKAATSIQYSLDFKRVSI